MAPETADVPSPDAVLVAACVAARAATLAYVEAVDRDDPHEAMAPLFERERNAFEAVAALKTNTARGVAEKARLLADFECAVGGCEPTPEMVQVAMSIAEDAFAMVRAMVGAAA